MYSESISARNPPEAIQISQTAPYLAVSSDVCGDSAWEMESGWTKSNSDNLAWNISIPDEVPLSKVPSHEQRSHLLGTTTFFPPINNNFVLETIYFAIFFNSRMT